MSSAAAFRAAYLALVVSVTLGTAGCAQGELKPPPPASPAATPTAEATELAPDASADEALAYFDSVNRETLAENPDANGRDFVDALVNAGFEASAMQLTHDTSTVGNPAESIQFSVRWRDSCLIGQNGPSVGGYHSAVADPLSDGACLIGATRAIDR